MKAHQASPPAESSETPANAGVSSFQGPDQTATAHSATRAATTPEPQKGPMADSPTIVSTPYPTYIPGGDSDSDDAYRAQLISHANASVERNQDSQFAALRSQVVQGEVNTVRAKVHEAQFETERGDRQAEREAARQFAELKAELAVLRAESSAREVATLRSELGESRASARQDAMTGLLAQILAKLPG